ncbi:MAG: PAS domain S-box protein, partial [Chloroflexi bacterium]|nr:PAS domain S-box protein [Chloroflexota bacterium]
SGAVFTFQVILYQDGVFDVTYNGLPLPFTFDPDATPSANPWIRGVVSGMGEPLHTNAADLLLTAQTGGSPLIENYQLAFRRYLHNFMLPFARIMIGGSILLLFGLPLLLHFSIIKPLESLLEGVRKMESGDLTVKVPVQNEDEIGFLTHAFNTMAARQGQRMTGLEERFRQFFEYEPDYCYMVSPGGNILDANPAALAALEYAKDDLVGKPLDIIYAPESISTVEQLSQKWQENGELINEEIIILTRSGERRTVLLSAGAVRDQDGNLLHSLSIQRDISERVRAEEALLDLAMIEERRRVASDLHDSMTQSLHSLVLSTETAQHLHRENQPEKLAASLEMLGDSARQTLQEMRLLLYGLSLTSDEQVDLFEILETRLESVERRLGIKTELNIDNRGVIPKDCERELFFIIVEALNNALRHGRADHVWVSISGTPYQVTVKVRDNGCGFSPDQIGKGGGMGIKNMTERVSSMGGLLKIDSKPGGGATIHAQINLDCIPTAESEE